MIENARTRENADGNRMNRKEGDAASPRSSSELAGPLLLILKQCIIGAADIVAIVPLGAARRDRSAPDRTFATPVGPPPSSLPIQSHPGSSRNPHWKVEIGNKTAAIGRRRPRGRMPNSIRQSRSLYLVTQGNAYRPDGRCVRFSITTCARWLAELKVKREGRAREGDEKGRCEEERAAGARLGWQARNEQVTRSTRSSLTGIRTVWTGYA